MDGDADSAAEGKIDASVALRAEVATLRARLAEGDQRVSEFVARLAHELRAPLGAILMWAHVLRLGRENDRDAAIDAIEMSARAESKIISRLLDVCQALAGRLRINRAILDLREAVRAAAEEHLPGAHAHGVALEVTIGDTPVFVNGDAGRIREIVSNLMSNGIKFTPSGGTVAVSLTQVDQYARIRVSDTGLGFEREELADVFSPFRGAGDGDLRAGAGLGVGLTLAGLLTEVHGGTIAVDSKGKGRGTAFTVDLPLAPS